MNYNKIVGRVEKVIQYLEYFAIFNAAHQRHNTGTLGEKNMPLSLHIDLDFKAACIALAGERERQRERELQQMERKKNLVNSDPVFKQNIVQVHNPCVSSCFYNMWNGVYYMP